MVRSHLLRHQSQDEQILSLREFAFAM